MLPTRGSRRALTDAVLAEQLIGHVACGTRPSSRLGYVVKINSSLDPSRCRNYSSTTSPNPSRNFTHRIHPRLLLVQNTGPASLNKTTTIAQRLAPNLSQIRHQSTSQPGPFNTPLPPGDYGINTTELLPDAANEAQLAATGGSVGQWGSGYLRELGLDFGWGPTSTLQWVFEHLHMYDGLTIGGTIVATAILIRLATFPTVIAASNTTSRLGALVEITKPVQARMRKAAAERDQMELQTARTEMKKIYQAADIKLWKSFLPMINIPLGFGFWRLTRNMADLPVPGMETGGFLWFPNLVTYDPYFILPIATGLIQHISMRFGGETASTTEASKKMRAIFVYGLPIMAPIFIGFAPAAVQLSFCTASILSLCTTTALRQPSIRALFSLPPIIRPAAATGPTGPTSPYQGAITVSGRVKDSPHAAKATSAAQPKMGMLDKFRPGNIKKGMDEMSKTAYDFVSEAVPSAKNTVQTKQEKAAAKRAEEYEVKRQRQIEKAREQARGRNGR